MLLFSCVINCVILNLYIHNILVALMNLVHCEHDHLVSYITVYFREKHIYTPPVKQQNRMRSSNLKSVFVTECCSCTSAESVLVHAQCTHLNPQTYQAYGLYEHFFVLSKHYCQLYSWQSPANCYSIIHWAVIQMIRETIKITYSQDAGFVWAVLSLSHILLHFTGQFRTKSVNDLSPAATSYLAL